MAKFIIAALFLACSACKTGAGLGSAPIKLSVSSWPETVDALFKLGSCLLHQGDSVFTQTIMNLCAAGERLKKR